MLTGEMNELLGHVGPRTRGGDFMRRYWHPVALSADIAPGGQPREVRILGEDLVLFRDDAGRPGLVGLHCAHRLVSLAYGRVEDGGIRCPMHGWLYDVAGSCLDQPAEPDPDFKNRIHHVAYPCRDLGGLIFTYMGPPETMSLLPNYEVMARTDGTRWCSYYPINGGYLQHLEGAVDTVHAEYLHQNNWSRMKHEIAAMPKPRIEYTETEYGLRQHGEKPHPSGEVGPIYTYFFMPAGFVRLGGSYVGDHDVEIQKFQSWYVPVDDGHTIRFQVAFQPFDAQGKGFPWRPDGRLVQPGADEDYGRDYEGNDTITGITPTTPGTFRAQDTMSNETQGTPFMDRSLEHLGAHDKVLMAMRLVIAKGISDVEKGLDPKHVIRDPAQNEMVYVRGPEPLEHFLAERAGVLVPSPLVGEG